MRKLLILLLVSLLLLLTPLANARVVKEDNGEHVEFEIVQGWNLVPLYLSNSLGTDSWSFSGLNNKETKAAYLLDSRNKKYISILNTYVGNNKGKSAEESSLYDAAGKDQEFLSNLLFSAIWIYSSSGGTTVDHLAGTFAKGDEPLQKLGGAKMYKGWNMFSITPDVAKHGRLREIIGDCTITKAVAWNAPSQQWQTGSVEYLLDTEPIDQSDVGQVVLLKVAADCKMREPAAAPIAPPVIPD